jgi:hypothetical protein
MNTTIDRPVSTSGALARYVDPMHRPRRRLKSMRLCHTVPLLFVPA